MGKAGLAAIIYAACEAQTARARAEFEVADIQPSKPGTRQDFKVQPGGRIDAKAITLRDLIAFAWDVEDEMVLDAPSGIATDGFDLIAKPPHSALEKDPKNEWDANIDKLKPMVQTMLIDRFGLKMHMGQKETAVYAITVGKHGHKLKESAAGESKCSMQVIEGVRTYVCQNMTMQGLADQIRPVLRALAGPSGDRVDRVETRVRFQSGMDRAGEPAQVAAWPRRGECEFERDCGRSGGQRDVGLRRVQQTAQARIDGAQAPHARGDRRGYRACADRELGDGVRVSAFCRRSN